MRGRAWRRGGRQGWAGGGCSRWSRPAPPCAARPRSPPAPAPGGCRGAPAQGRAAQPDVRSSSWKSPRMSSVVAEPVSTAKWSSIDADPSRSPPSADPVRGQAYRSAVTTPRTPRGQRPAILRAIRAVERELSLLDTPREVAAAAEVVFTMVTDTAALVAVTEGDDGILAGLAPGKVYV